MINHQLRRQGIGGSEIGVVMDVDPWRDAFSLVRAKRGELEWKPPSLRMRLGTAAEPIILDDYENITGHALVRGVGTFQCPDRPWQVATPDALWRDGRGGVDAKKVEWDQRDKWGATPDDIPVYIQFQGRWYMSAFDRPQWDIAALIGDGICIYTLERNLEVEAVLLEKAEEFWRRYILGDETPPIGWSDDTRRWIHSRYPANTGDIRGATADEVSLLEKYRDLRIQLKALERERNEIENKLKNAVGESSGIEWIRGRFSWKMTDSAGIDWKGLAGGLFKDYRITTDERAERERQYTRPGIRRISFRSEGVEI